MEQQLANVHHHMKELGLGALAHANWHANYFSHENPWWSELSVLQAAHAAEILIKARIAQEHPLLIFEQLPKATSAAGNLSFRDLIEGGRTYQFVDLPDRLWATTGIKLPNIARFRAFGRLRNAIQHFSGPDDVDVGDEALRFIYEVVDLFINECWGLFAVDYNEDYEPHLYLVEGLVRRGIRFLVSPDAAASVDCCDLEWPSHLPDYRAEMSARFEVVARDSQLNSE